MVACGVWKLPQTSRKESSTDGLFFQVYWDSPGSVAGSTHWKLLSPDTGVVLNTCGDGEQRKVACPLDSRAEREEGWRGSIDLGAPVSSLQ